ncbi:MAG: hypothetical protein EXQ56_05120 [Acidobacteria bacterium]|nr:hypothetical protein [Acidobacteriota bacterium]
MYWRQFCWVALAIVALSFLALGWPQQNQTSKVLVLKGATLIDGTGQPPVPDAVIVIEGDKVRAAGEKQTRYPADAAVVELAGKFVIPGFVDSHVHYQRWLGELLLNHGVTTVVSMQARDVYGDAYYRESQRSDNRVPRLYDSGGSLSLSPAMTREQVRTNVREWMKREPEFAKLPVYNEQIRQPYQWMAEEIHEAGFAIIGHAENCRDAAAAGLDILEHLWGCAVSLMTPEEAENFREGQYLHWGLFLKGGARMDSLIQEVIRHGTAYINPTLLYEFGSQANMAAQFETDSYNIYRNPALMTYYPKNLADGLLSKFRTTRSFSTKYGAQVLVARLSDEEVKQSKEAYHLAGAFVKRWVALGGKVMGGVDTPSIGTAGLAVHLELAMLVESGLTPMQALQSFGLWGAEMITARRKPATRPLVGVLAEGSYADLLVLSANPLQDIANARVIERVMKGGEFISLGYTAHYTSAPANLVRPTPFIQEPEISAIMPHRVAEGIAEFELVVDGEGFLPDSVVRVDGVAVPTTFLDIRTLKAKIPASVAAQATPNRFVLGTNPEQRVGVYGDRTVKITVLTAPPDGGVSNSVSLKVVSKWLAEKTSR